MEKNNKGMYTITCVKTETFYLKPFGKFLFKWKKTKLYDLRPNWLLVQECDFNHDLGMPLTEKQENEFIKLMKKYNTDVFVDDRGYSPTFYTRTNSGVTQVRHRKITELWEAQNNKYM
jgi:hypothetical protein